MRLTVDENIKQGRIACLSDETGKLITYTVSSVNPPIGVAARDIAEGEIVELRIGGNSKDIITKTT